MLGYGGAVDFQVGPLCLQPLFQPCEYPGSTSCGSGHQEMIFTQTGGDTVIKDHPVSLAHQAVAALPFGQCRKHVCIYAVEENCSVRALYINFSEGGGVHHGDT